MGISDLFKSDKGAITFLIFGLILIVVSGFVLSIIYYLMSLTATSLESVNCQINNNSFFDDCQGMFEMVVYPFLAAKSILVYLSVFFIFILIIGILLSGYNSGTKPYMLGVLLLLEIGLTYASLWVANIYRTLLDNEIIKDAMIPFGFYNEFMLNLPYFVFIISLFSLLLGVVNWQNVRKNTTLGDLDY